MSANCRVVEVPKCHAVHMAIMHKSAYAWPALKVVTTGYALLN